MHPSARQLYNACRFIVEGILRAEFFPDGRYVDDDLMARHLVPGEYANVPHDDPLMDRLR